SALDPYAAESCGPGGGQGDGARLAAAAATAPRRECQSVSRSSEQVHPAPRGPRARRAWQGPPPELPQRVGRLRARPPDRTPPSDRDARRPLRDDTAAAVTRGAGIPCHVPAWQSWLT